MASKQMQGAMFWLGSPVKFCSGKKLAEEKHIQDGLADPRPLSYASLKRLVETPCVLGVGVEADSGCRFRSSSLPARLRFLFVLGGVVCICHNVAL
jgi:hypothetical protein